MPLSHPEPGPWTKEESDFLCAIVLKWGDQEHWKKIAGFYPGKSPEQCQAQWFLHLAPKNRKQSPWTEQEERK